MKKHKRDEVTVMVGLWWLQCMLLIIFNAAIDEGITEHGEKNKDDCLVLPRDAQTAEGRL